MERILQEDEDKFRMRNNHHDQRASGSINTEGAASGRTSVM